MGVVWTLAIGAALGVTQEELAQYVAQQQTAGLGLGAAAVQPRRQPFLLSAQPKAAAYQAEPRPQVYQIQPKAQAYQAPKTYQAESEQQYYQPQPEQAPAAQYYQPRPQAQPARKLVRPQSGQQLDDQQQLPEDYDPNPQYQFGFDIQDDEFTNYQNRKEQREGGKISGSYSVVDSDGYIRTVTYTADPLEGFKADVVRKPTDIKIKIPQPQLLQSQPQQQPQYESQGLSARQQQTQQYLQATQPKQQYTQALSGGQGQQLRQFAANPYQGQLQYQQ